MRIGVVCYPTYGGSGVVATELGKALAEKGHSVHLISYRTPARLDKLVENMYYHETDYADYPLFERAPYETALSSTIVHVAQYERIDLLHVHYAIPHASTAFLAREILKKHGYHLPYIVTLHGTDITLVGLNKTYAPVVNFSINAADGVTAVSEWLKQETLNNFRIERPITVIPNFVDVRRFQRTKQEVFRKAIAPQGEKILTHISNFRPVKRMQDVVRIFYQVRARMPARLLMVGDGPERQAVEQLTRELDVAEDVLFLGKVDPVEEVLGISDLFLLPSQSESFGLAALEAMASQVPVIATRAGGLTEIVVDGKTGYLCPVGDVDCMAQHACRILEDPVIHEQMKTAAVRQAQRFDVLRIVPLYEAYYKQILEQRTEM